MTCARKVQRKAPDGAARRPAGAGPTHRFRLGNAGGANPRSDHGAAATFLAGGAFAFLASCRRFGSAVYSAAELKAIQEVITLIVFAVFAATYLGQKVTLGQGIGFALIAAGAFFVFRSPIH